MRLLWLPTVLRAAGLTVHEVSGWKTRGNDSYGPVRGITCHHTAGSRNSTVQGELNVLLNGSNSAPAPIAQLLLARNGDWHVVASGLCYHNLDGWGGPNAGYGNDALLGIEAQHSGGTEPWTDVQYGSYVRGVAALVRHKASGYDVAVARVAGHKEHQPGDKSDPTFNMTTFRANVSRAPTGEGNDMSEKASRIIEAYANGMPKTSSGEIVAPTVWRQRDEVWQRETTAALNAQKLRDEAVLAAVRDDADRDAILARIDQRAAELRDGIPAAILSALPDGDGPVSRDDLVAAITQVLGSVDGASPAS